MNSFEEYLSEGIHEAVRLQFPSIEFQDKYLGFASPRHLKHGDISSPIALRLSSFINQPPADVAHILLKSFAWDSSFVKIPETESECIHKGFLNFYFNDMFLIQTICRLSTSNALTQKEISANSYPQSSIYEEKYSREPDSNKKIKKLTSNELPRSRAMRYLYKYISPPTSHPFGYFNASPAGGLHELLPPAGEGRDGGAESRSRASRNNAQAIQGFTDKQIGNQTNNNSMDLLHLSSERISAILRAAKNKNINYKYTEPTLLTFSNDNERELARVITVAEVLDQQFTDKVTQAFKTFYLKCPIFTLSHTTNLLRCVLTDATSHILKKHGSFDPCF